MMSSQAWSQVPETVKAAVAVSASEVSFAWNWWWDFLNKTPAGRDTISYILATSYATVAVVALAQLVKSWVRLPECGWTTQKVFQLLSFFMNAIRFSVFLFHPNIHRPQPVFFNQILLDTPNLLFFTTYTLFVLFWAEIYNQAHRVSTDGLRPTFYAINLAAYSIQSALWLSLCWWSPGLSFVLIASKMFFVVLSLVAAIGFLVYGGSLFVMIKRFPAETKGRRRKLEEIGYVTLVCFFCFVVRGVILCLSVFNGSPMRLDVFDLPVLNMAYYVLVEVMPSMLVLSVNKVPQKCTTMSTLYEAKKLTLLPVYVKTVGHE